MALGWFTSGKDAPLAELIARKRYGKAIELLRAQFQGGVRDPRMRLQLADVLVLAGRPAEAIPILSALADEFAREGFAAKAIAVLKKIERLAPGRADVERRLAELIHKRLGPPPVPAAEGDEIGLEALGFAATSVAPAPAVPSSLVSAAGEPEFDLGPLVPPPASAAPADDDAAPAEEAFEEEFFDALQDMIDDASAVAAAQPPAPSAAAARPAVESPLFAGFSEEELAAVIAGLQLLTFDAGDVVVTEGQPGDSLFLLTTGTLKAFVRDGAGRNVFVREMTEGTFFGELSMLSGKPRSATVTCATRVELLELDRDALAEIVAAQPRVQLVIQQMAAQRRGSRQELAARGSAPA